MIRGSRRWAQLGRRSEMMLRRRLRLRGFTTSTRWPPGNAGNAGNAGLDIAFCGLVWKREGCREGGDA